MFQNSAPAKGDRRLLLKLAGTTLASASVIRGASAQPGAPQLDNSGRVTAARLDALAEKAFPLFNAAHAIPAFDAGRFQGRNDVDLHRITSHTVVPETRERLKISGLLAVPAGARGEVPVVSWQHGTILSFNQVPSNMTRLANAAYEPTDAADSLETLFNLHRFAAQGFAVIAADYVGKGPYREGRGEGYLVKGVSTQTCLDTLDAGQAALRGLGLTPGKLFLHGWSQGALNTQWLHQALRQASRPVTATAVASPFNDLNDTLRYWMGAETFPLPAGTTAYPAPPDWATLCLIILLGSYELQYRIDGLMQAALRPQYRDLAAKYWNDYRLDFDRSQHFPSVPEALIPGFLNGYTDDRNSAFLRRLASATSSYWEYDAPIRFHYGLADEAIHPAMVYRALSAGGRLATGVPVTGASHRSTFLGGMYGDPSVLNGKDTVLDWFRSLL